MTDKQLMRLVIENPTLIKDKWLPPSLMNMFKIIKGRGDIGMTSASMSDELNVSVYHASIQLKKLHKKGYLTRVKMVAESGGIEYIYKDGLYD